VKKNRSKLVYVDDQRDNLVVFEAQVSENWEIRCYLHAADALKDLAEFSPAIILSDMKMGKMNGVEFLLKGKELVPCAVRMVISGYSDEELMVASVRYAQIFDYVRKPYDPEDVEVRLHKALSQYEENIRIQSERTSFEKVNSSLSLENQKLKELVHYKNDELGKLKLEYEELKKRLTNLAG
jgi:response regulator RpfG family c-di-GMP phosphodiesterase